MFFKKKKASIDLLHSNIITIVIISIFVLALIVFGADLLERYRENESIRAFGKLQTFLENDINQEREAYLMDFSSKTAVVFFGHDTRKLSVTMYPKEEFQSWTGDVKYSVAFYKPNECYDSEGEDHADKSICACMFLNYDYKKETSDNIACFNLPSGFQLRGSFYLPLEIARKENSVNVKGFHPIKQSNIEKELTAITDDYFVNVDENYHNKTLDDFYLVNEGNGVIIDSKITNNKKLDEVYLHVYKQEDTADLIFCYDQNICDLFKEVNSGNESLTETQTES